MKKFAEAARPAGGLRLARMLYGLLVAAVLLVPGQVARADHETRDGLYTDTHYIGIQFAYQFEWAAPWEADLDTVESVEGEYDRIVVRGPDATVECLLRFGDDLEEALETVIEDRTERYDDLEVVARDEGVSSGQPYVAATLAYDAPSSGEAGVLEYVQVSPTFAKDTRAATVTLSLVASAEALPAAYEAVQAAFVPNLGMTGAFFAGRPAGEGEAAGGSGLAGNAYESPTYGYRLEWDADVWEPSEATSEDDVDTLVLVSAGSALAFIAGADYGDAPGACVVDWTVYLAGEEGVDDWEPLAEEDGEAVAGEEDGRAWAAFTLTYTDEAGDIFARVNYVECRTLVEGEATLAIVHITSQDAYAAEAEAVAEVLATIEPSDDANSRDTSGGSGAARDDRDRDEDDRGDADSERAIFVSPTWGYTVTWDSELWTIWEASDERSSEEDGRDVLYLVWAESSYVPFPKVLVHGFAGYDGDPDACLAGLVAEEPNGSLVPADGVDSPATVPGAVAEIYEVSNGGLYAYYECRTLVPGEAVVQIRFLVEPSDYDEMLPIFEDILAGIQLPEE